VSRPARWWQRFLVRGVFWRQLLRWAVVNAPHPIEPMLMGFACVFFFFWGPGRRAILRNLAAILPGSTLPANLLRTGRLYWNFAWTISDNVRFKEDRTIPDWEFSGLRAFEELQSGSEGSIMLTAHMGSYDLGAQLFSERSRRRVTVVRAPEPDFDTHAFELRAAERGSSRSVKIDFNTRSSDLTFDLLEALQRGDVVAIQGDRVTPGIGAFRTTLFGKPADVPAGPFALAMATGAPIYPVFVIRMGRRRYRLLSCPPIRCQRTSRDREKDFADAVAAWTSILEQTIRDYWYQWYTFEDLAAKEAAA
jgi:phosphatidylinositol dimannoside acyltransferase